MNHHNDIKICNSYLTPKNHYDIIDYPTRTVSIIIKYINVISMLLEMFFCKRKLNTCPIILAYFWSRNKQKAKLVDANTQPCFTPQRQQENLGTASHSS